MLLNDLIFVVFEFCKAILDASKAENLLLIFLLSFFDSFKGYSALFQCLSQYAIEYISDFLFLTV